MRQIEPEHVMFSFIGALVLFVAIGIVFTVRQHISDSEQCRRKEGIPVLMRNGILCLPKGAAIPLD